MTHGSKALVRLVLAGTLGAISGCEDSRRTDGAQPAVSVSGCPKGSQDCLPDVSYIDTNGVAYTAQSLSGKVVVVNFWATWCKPCLKEIPDLSAIYAKYKPDVMMLGVLSSDHPDSATLLNFQSDNDMAYPVIRESSDILLSYDYPRNLPTTFIFDRSGRKVKGPGQGGSYVGALSAEKLTGILEPLLKKP